MSDNPFEVSDESYGDRRRSRSRQRDTDVEVDGETIQILRETRPWVSLMAVLMWLGVAIIVIAILYFAANGALLAPQGIMVIALMALGGVIYGYLAKCLSAYASRIGRLNATESVADLEDALQAQKDYWRVFGIILLVSIVLVAVLLVIAAASGPRRMF